MKSSMKVLFTLTLISILGFETPLSAQDQQKPSILFCTWGIRDRGKIDYDYLQFLVKKGYVVDFLATRKNMTWERISKFNVIVLFDFPNKGKPRTKPESCPENSISFEKTMELLDRFLKEGGGVLISLQRFGDKHFYPATREALQHWGADVPAEYIAVPETKIGRHPRLRGTPYFYTQNIAPSPVSKDVKGVWYPVPHAHKFGHFPLMVTSGPIVVNKDWTAVVRAPKGSVTEPIDFTPIAKSIHLNDPLQRKNGVEEPPIFAIRKVGRGRLALFWAMGVFHFRSGMSWLHNGAMFDKGLKGKRSDFGRLLLNTYQWLGEPSLKNKLLGGAEIDQDRIKPPQFRSTAKATVDRGWKAGALHSQGQKSGKLFRGFVGAQTEFSGGKGSLRQYADAAQKADLNFIVFLEDFRNFKRSDWDDYKKKCLQLSTDELMLIPGFKIPSNLGNTFFVYGPGAVLPYPEMILGKGKNAIFMYQEVDKKTGKYKYGAQCIDYILYRIGRPNANAGFYDFRGPNKEKGALLPQHLRVYSAAGLMLYRDGKLVEDMTDEFLLTNQGTLGSLPLSIDIVDSPEKMVKAVKDGHFLTYAGAPNLKKVWPNCLSWNHQYKGPNISVSNGPQVLAWPGCIRIGTFGSEDFVTDRIRMSVLLHVTSDKGLKEICIYDGKNLFRRFLPKGKKEFKEVLHLYGVLQQNLSVVAYDVYGNKAVSFPLRTSKAGYQFCVSFCGDHVNQGNMLLARGPTWQSTTIVPEVPDAGYTWDGGPKAKLPLLEVRSMYPRMVGEKETQIVPPNQVPLLVINDERVYQGKCIADEIVTPDIKRQNPWISYGPIIKAPLYKGDVTLTAWGQYPVNVAPNSWGTPGMNGGCISTLYEQDIEFVKDAFIKKFDMGYNWRKELPMTNAMLVIGNDNKIVRVIDVTPRLSPAKKSSHLIKKGAWFALISEQPANEMLFVNRGDDLIFEISDRRNDLKANWPTKGKNVKKGETHHVKLFGMVWPMDINVPDTDALLRYINYLLNPDDFKLIHGTRKSGPPGILDFVVDNGYAEFSLKKPKDKLNCSIPVRLNGLNPRWSAHLFQLVGYNGKKFYSNGKNKVRPLGVEPRGKAYFPVYAGMALQTHMRAGHPVIADAGGKDLFIQATAIKGDKNCTPTSWHVSVNNPTDKPVTTKIKQGMDIPGLQLPESEITLEPGEYRVLLPPPEEKKTK